MHGTHCTGQIETHQLIFLSKATMKEGLILCTDVITGGGEDGNLPCGSEGAWNEISGSMFSMAAWQDRGTEFSS